MADSNQTLDQNGPKPPVEQLSVDIRPQKKWKKKNSFHIIHKIWELGYLIFLTLLEEEKEGEKREKILQEEDKESKEKRGSIHRFLCWTKSNDVIILFLRLILFLRFFFTYLQS